MSAPTTRILVVEGGVFVTAATDADVIGEDVYEIPGVEDAFGADFRLVACCREPHCVRRFWRGSVWDAHVEPYGNGGIYAELIEVERIGAENLVTFRDFVDAATRISESLERGAGDA